MAEQSEDRPHVRDAALPPVERLVNLTEHAITVESLTSSTHGEGGVPVPLMVTFEPDGRLARVPDDRARLGEGWVNTAAGLLRETRLRRRAGSVAGLPAPEPGVRYLVSRVTALAVRDRKDLVFPFVELRDERGRMTGVRGLASFPPGPAMVERLRGWRRKASGRRSRRPLTGEWRTGLLFALATAFLSAWLGLLPGSVDNALKNGWAGGGQAWTSWLSLAFLVLGAVTLAVAARRWYVGLKVREDRGTAYVIEEQAIAWRHEEKQWVLDELAGGFARVLRVPGPEALGERWHWQADARCAAQWDRCADQLVHSFWAVHYNDDQVTRNAVFVWAPWPVAMAFGARATARRRGLVLHVRQRPSSGALGQRHELRLTDPAHDFLRTATKPEPDAAARVQHAELTAGMTITIKTIWAAGEAVARQPDAGLAALLPVRLLVVRIVQQEIGEVPLELAVAPGITVHAPGCLTASVLRPGSRRVQVAEWRSAGGEIPWEEFPATAETIASWIAGQAEAHPGHVLLLAARMPQEIAVGLGIQLGQRHSAWPDRLYPVYWTEGELFVPDLDLGRHSVPPERP
jgi:hypothetical protein